MQDEELGLLKESVELGKSNEKILKKLLSAQRRGAFIFWLKWAIIVGLSVGGYYYLQPFIEALMGTYSQIGNGLQSVSDLNSSLSLPNIGDLINNNN